jgi:hypothetical protein
MSRLDDRYPDLLEDNDRAMERAVLELDAVFAVRPSPRISATMDRAVYEGLAAPRVAIATARTGTLQGRRTRILYTCPGGPCYAPR